MRFYLISIISTILLLLAQETEALKLKSHEQARNAIHRRVRFSSGHGGGGGYIGLAVAVCILILVIIVISKSKPMPQEGDEIIEEEVVIVEEHHDVYEGGTEAILQKSKIVKKRPNSDSESAANSTQSTQHSKSF